MKIKLQLSFITFFKLNKNNLKDFKLYTKYSYLILALLKQSFLFYTLELKKQTPIFSCAILKKKSNVLTITKAPMAHKKWSKEQYNIQYFLITFVIKQNIIDKYLFNTSMIPLLRIFYFSNYQFSPETNIYFLKNKKLFLPIFIKKNSIPIV